MPQISNFKVIDPTSLRSSILEKYYYHAADGDLYSRKTKRPIRAADKEGYLKCRILRRMTKVHHIIWFLETNTWPDKQIDHINGAKNDNRFCNLRLATQSQNEANKQPTSQKTGAVWIKHLGKWRARIDIGNGRKKHLGYFASAEEANNAYINAHKQMYGEYSFYSRLD